MAFHMYSIDLTSNMSNIVSIAMLLREGILWTGSSFKMRSLL
jgi:hypothetical protein